MSPPVARLFGDLLHRFQQEGEQRQAAYQAKRSQWTDLQLRLRVAQLEERLRMLGDQPPPGLPQSELERRLEDFQKLARQKAQAQLAFDLEQLTQSDQGPVPPEPGQPPGLVQITLRPEEGRLRPSGGQGAPPPLSPPQSDQPGPARQEEYHRLEDVAVPLQAGHPDLTADRSGPEPAQ